MYNIIYLEIYFKIRIKYLKFYYFIIMYIYFFLLPIW